MILKSFKVELNPNNEQKTLLEKHAGCSRFAYNWMLSLLEHDYATGTKLYKPNAIQFHKLLNSKKESEFPWMYEVSKSAPQFALKDCEIAFERFFKKTSKFPRYKKKGLKDSFTVDGAVKTTKTYIQLPRIGNVGLKESEYVPEGKPTKATISKKSGRWFVSVSYEVEPHHLHWTNEVIGVDLGIKTLMTCSDGTTVNNSTKLKELEDSLKRQQRKLSRQNKGSKNRNKTKLKIQKLHFRISNSRKDILHKATSMLTKTKQHGTIVIEDLNVKGMMKNHKLAKAISNVGFYEFKRQLTYKCLWYGKELIVADRFFPSSKLCSCCGSLKEDLKLSDRTYNCDCGNSLDRDLNAAINLSKNTVSSTEINACVSKVKTALPKKIKRVGKSIVKKLTRCSTEKQELNNKSDGIDLYKF